MKAPQPVSRGERVAFELDRFEVVGDDSCELEGRWFGVRGRRFMRPALTVLRDGEPTRVLADLAGKPWAAEDGEPWTATFPRPEGDQDAPEAELTVAPDINIPLPAPKKGGRPRSTSNGTTRKKSTTRTKSTRSERTARTESTRASTNGNRKASKPPEPDPEQDRLRDQLERAEADRAQASARVDALLDELGQARAERDEARAERGALVAERDEAVAKRDAAVAERDAAVAKRDAAAAERDAAVAARDAAATARDTAIAERDHALTERDATISARDTALAGLAGQADAESRYRAALKARDNALAERDAALMARSEAVAKAEELGRENERLQTELGHATASNGASLVTRQVTHDASAYGTDIRLLPRVIAVVALLAMVIALLIVARVV